MKICAAPGDSSSRPLHDGVDRLGRQVDDVLGRPVVAVARRVVQRALQVGVAGRARRSRPPGRGRGPARGPPRRRRRSRRACRAAPMHTRPRRWAGMSSSSGAVNTAQASESAGGAAFMTSRKRGQHLGGAVELEQRDAAEHLLRQRVQRELERGHDAERAAAAAQGPEQLGVLVGGRAHDAPVPGHELGGDEVVAGEPVQPLEPAGAAAQGQAGDAGAGDAPARRGQAVLARRTVDLRPRWRRRRRVPRAAPGRPPPRRAGAGRARPRRRTASGRPRSARRRGPRSGRSCARATARAAATSSASRGRTTTSGCRSICALKSVQASS